MTMEEYRKLEDQPEAWEVRYDVQKFTGSDSGLIGNYTFCFLELIRGSCKPCKWNDISKNWAWNATPLFMATHKGKKEVVKLLLKSQNPQIHDSLTTKAQMECGNNGRYTAFKVLALILLGYLGADLIELNWMDIQNFTRKSESKQFGLLESFTGVVLSVLPFLTWYLSWSLSRKFQQNNPKLKGNNFYTPLEAAEELRYKDIEKIIYDYMLKNCKDDKSLKVIKEYEKRREDKNRKQGYQAKTKIVPTRSLDRSVEEG